ncbi:MAG TPA: sigma-70 family RNA polymerase sigma factor [Polyangiales bacterium]|nr:sigma-70 family RNA polymerase sigma factor [Polyangiales bacterium]
MAFLRPVKSSAQRDFEADALLHLDALYAHALRLTRSPSDADDLVQDTFVKALRFHDRFERGTNLKAWLLRIQFNSFVNKYRRNVKELSIADSMSNEPAGDATLGRAALRSLLDPQSAALRPVVSGEIEAALASLPEDHRTVVLLADVEELSYKEIAEVMACPIGTVMSRLHRARKTLQHKLAEHAESLGLKPVVTESTATPAAEPAPNVTETNTISLASYKQRSRG